MGIDGYAVRRRGGYILLVMLNLNVVRGVLIAVVVFFVVVLSSCAQVRISEVMYNPEGANERRLWIEVINVSSETLSLAAYRVRDSGSSNHAIQGVGTLEPAEVGVIVSDPSTFGEEFPFYKADVYRSPLDLRGGTERSVALLNSAGDVVHRVVYSPANGANNDGNSLHILSDERIRARRPSPGELSVAQANLRRLAEKAPTADQSVSHMAGETVGEQDTLSTDTVFTESVIVDSLPPTSGDTQSDTGGGTLPTTTSAPSETGVPPPTNEPVQPQPAPRAEQQSVSDAAEQFASAEVKKIENQEDSNVVVDKNVENVPILEKSNMRTIIFLFALIIVLMLPFLFFVFKIEQGSKSKKSSSSKKGK